VASGDRARRRRRVGAVVAVAAGVLAIAVPITVAGRQRPAPSPGPAPALAAPAVAPELTPPVLTPREQQALPVSTGTPVPGEVKGMPGLTGCPVDAPELLAALRDSKISARLAETRRLTDVDCYASYALARTDPEAATVLFHYSDTTASWRAISGGKSEDCAKVPEAVRTHLRGCS
jgi:hypothetical protein